MFPSSQWTLGVHVKCDNCENDLMVHTCQVILHLSPSWSSNLYSPNSYINRNTVTYSHKSHILIKEPRTKKSTWLEEYIHAASKLNLFLFTLHNPTPSHRCPPDPVNEEVLSDNRKMITNQQLELYNEAAVDVLNSSKRNGKSRVKLLAASRQAAMETITLSDDGLHLPESTRNVVGRVTLYLLVIRWFYSVAQVQLSW